MCLKINKKKFDKKWKYLVLWVIIIVSFYFAKANRKEKAFN